jgi:sugar phosphate isomerase/epimerase
MPHQISVQTMEILEHFGIDEGFKMIHDAGFDGVDFNFVGREWNFKRFDMKSSFDQDDEALREAFRPYKEAAEKHNVRIIQMHAPAPGWSPFDSAEVEDYVIRAYEKVIMLCSYMNCSHLIVHPFFPEYHRSVSAEKEWETNIRLYSRLIPAAKKYDVTICLENMFTVFKGKIYSAICQEPEEVNRYIDTLNEMAGKKVFAFCLDTGHSLLVGKDILRVICALGHRIETLHIHDNDQWHDSHQIPFSMQMDFEAIVKALKEIGYSGYFTLEADQYLSAYDREHVFEGMCKMKEAAGKLAEMFEQEEAI